MGWQSWLSRGIGYGLAPFTGGLSAGIGEGIAQGIDASKGIDKAVGQQTAATAGAQQRLDAAGQTAGNVLNQQRNDFQSFANAPFQTLAQLSGVSIPNVQPMAGLPQGGGTLASLTPMAGVPAVPMSPDVMPPQSNRRASLPAQQQFASGYGGRF